jgi:hypothetical protein
MRRLLLLALIAAILSAVTPRSVLADQGGGATSGAGTR